MLNSPGAVRFLVALVVLAATGQLRAGDPSGKTTVRRLDGTSISAGEIDRKVRRLMERENVPGLALALIENGQPVLLRAWGQRDVAGAKPLQTDTVMYAASLTKLVFAYLVMQLVDDGIIRLDEPIAAYFKQPLPEYPKYADLAGDERWRKLTARMLLSHTPGFPNFRFLNPDGKLDFKFEPGSRYAYSGEGINLLQFVLEQGLGLDVAKEMQRRVFDRFGMTRTSLTWREDFTTNAADGYDVNGKLEPHRKRLGVRAAGSMDTTIEDYAKFLAGFLRGDGLSPAGRAEMLRGQIEILSAQQFPTMESPIDPANAGRGLAAGLGGVMVRGPQGLLFWKGGHDDWTGNLALALTAKQRGLVLLSNSVRGERIFPEIVRMVWGEAGLPWAWEYGAPRVARGNSKIQTRNSKKDRR